ncbi:MAG: PilZ domain-containing protein [Candidatus Binatia bacterium]
MRSLPRERRASPRWKAPGGSYARFPEGASAIADIGFGGLRIDDSDPLPEGTRLDMRLHLCEQIIPCVGVVRRCVPGKSMGIRFVGFPEGELNRLRSVLFELRGR